MNPEARIKARAHALGFEAVGIAPPTMSSLRQARLAAVLKNHQHGSMHWLDNPRRFHPRRLWPQTQAVVVLAHAYTPAISPLKLLKARQRGTIAAYAWGRDYHKTMNAKLKALARDTSLWDGATAKPFVDTAPLMEKPLAEAAGVGWQGKHTNLVSRTMGSWFFLGVLLTDAPLKPDAAHTDHCGSCSRCMDICPTQAIEAPYQLNPQKCLAYYAIEHKGIIPRQFRAPMGNRIFGCDDCLAVCPWNRFAQKAREADYQPRELRVSPPLATVLALSEAEFLRIYTASPIRRLGHARFIRNCLIAAGNSAETDLIPLCEPYLLHQDSTVRAHAVWALIQLNPQASVRYLHHQEQETHPGVRAEWQAWCS